MRQRMNGKPFGSLARAALALLVSGQAALVAGELEFKGPAAAKAFLQKVLATRDPTRQVQALVKKLGDESWDVREGATKELTAFGPAAAPFLEDAVKSGDPEVSWRARQILNAQSQKPQDISDEVGRAADVLAAAKEKRLVPTLLELLGHARVDVRYAAEYGLRRIARRNFGYNAYAEKKARSAAVARWAAWWKGAEATFAFDAKPSPRPKIAGVLISSRRFPRVWMVDLQGEMVWSKDFVGRSYAAARLSNGRLVIANAMRGVVEEHAADGRVVWATDAGALRGSVMDVQRLANGNTLVAHTSGRRLVELDGAGKIVWSRRVARSPYSARRLPSGNTLVASWSNPGKVVELTRGGKVAWATEDLMMPASAVKLPNGNVLIAEYRAQRVIEVDRKGQMVWQRECVGRPLCALRLPDGSTVISETVEGVILIGADGAMIRQLDDEARWARISLVPAAAKEAKGRAAQHKNEGEK